MFPVDLRDRHVKGLVRVEEPRRALLVSGLVAGAADFVERLQPGGVHLAGGHARGGGLEHEPQLEDVVDVPHGHGRHHVAAAGDRPHQPVVREAIQRHAHGRLAELVLGAELRFGNLGARSNRAGDDVVADALVGAVGEQWDRLAHGAGSLRRGTAARPGS